jgi:hypothetical protein
MKNQFFYTVEQDGKKLVGSLNMDLVVRSLEYEPGKLVVILNDFHESLTTRQVMEKGKPKMIRQKEYICSEIWLSEEDSIKFREITELK